MIRETKKKLIHQTRILSGIHDMAYILVMVVALALAPAIVAHAAEGQAATTAASRHANNFSEHVKRDAKAVGAAFTEAAHRVAVAAKAVAHEISTAFKRGAAETRTAMKGEKVDTTSPESAR